MTQEKHPITIDDLYRIATIEDPRISPDGQWIAYVHVTIDRLENIYKRNLWLAPVGGGQPIQLTRSSRDSSPRWSPDSASLAFVSARDKKPQIYLLRITAPGGEPRPLTAMPNGASSPAWSPDSTHIAFLSNMNADERATEDTNAETLPPADKLEARHRSEREEHEETQRWDPRVAWRLPYRAGTSYLDDRFAQIYVVPVAEGLSRAESKPRRLTSLDAHYDPPEWSPDGQHILTARSLMPEADQPGRYSALFRINTTTREQQQLTDETFMSAAPRPSPDGRWIAYTRLPLGDHFNERIARLAVIPTQGGEPRDLNLPLDRGLGQFHWAHDSQAVIFSAESSGDTEIYRAPVDGSPLSTLVSGTREITGFDYGANGGVVFAASTPTNPGELYWQAGADSSPTPLTTINQAFLDTVTVQPVHEMRYTLPDGHDIQGWYILPVGHQPGKPCPLIVNIHGGPHIMWGAATQSIWHENQSYAAAGYAVFYCNPRGAAGYGEAFQIALHARWGDLAFADIMAGVDLLINQGIADPDRLAVTGGSYGGYMTAWIVSHTHRFKAAVSQRGVYNLLSFFGTTDIPLFLKDEWGVLPWDDPMFLWQNSPMAHAHKIKTPLLITHSENDFRVHISEAEQLFAYVRGSGGTTRLVRFPREGHELSRSGEPAHRASRLNHILNWFRTYCQP